MTPERNGAGFEQRVADWIEVEAARERTLSSASLMGTETVPLDQASGRALAEPIEATATLPPWDNSAMDGYATRGADVRGASSSTPKRLPVSGVVRAGDPVMDTMAPGSAVRIMTGAPVPTDADTIIRVEDTDGEETPGFVAVRDDRDVGRHIRPAGQDLTKGMQLFPAGHSIGPGTIGVLAAAGRAEALVHRSPSVALLATGDELRTPEQYADVEAGRGVPESNGTMLAAATRAIGAHPLPLGIAADRSEIIREKLDAAESADVLVTIGGASMGEADLVKRVLDDYGFEQDFWRVRMRPGSPISFGWIPRDGRRQPVFGLPGNPSSAFVTFELFVRPFLLRMAGHTEVQRPIVPCTATERFSTPAALTYFQRVRLRPGPEGLTAGLTGPQLSGLVRGLASADGLAVIPPDVDVVEAGDPVDVVWFGGVHGSPMG
ncbi:MAG: gephyrin-like molybdotransferase Glp [Gemmatimonadota bacterium]